MALWLAGVASLLAGTLLASVPAGAAASIGYAVTELEVGAGPSVVAADSTTNTVYAGINDGLAVIDGKTNTLAAQITGLFQPEAIAVDPSTHTVYAFAGESAGELVAVINGTTVTAFVNDLPCGLPSAAVNPVTDLIYVTDCAAPGQAQAGGAVDVIDGKTNTVAATIPVSLGASQETSGVAVDPATNTIYVADPVDGQLAVIDGATNTVRRRIAVPTGVNNGVVFDPATGLVYTNNAAAGTISVINTAAGSVSTLVTGLSGAGGLALDPGTGTLYAVSLSGEPFPLGTTYVIDKATGAIEDQFPRGGLVVTVAVSGGPAYIAGSVLPAADITVATPDTVNTMSPVILGNTGFTFTVGQAGQGQLTVSATPQATFSATGLPGWLTLSPSGLLSGTPPAGTGGTYTATVTASNGVAPQSSSPISVAVDEPPAITSADHVTFHEGAAGSFAITATGWPASSITESGALPAGLTLYSAGVLSGTPAAGTAGVYPITVNASNGVSPPATQAFTLTVTAPTARAVALGVEGTDGQLWIQAPQLGEGWHPLGGVISGPPAVAAPPNADGTTPAQPLFIATGADRHLWIRSLRAGWQPLDGGIASCLGAPAAIITGTSTSGYALTVACRGTDNALWENSTAMPASGLPTLTAVGWTSLGGVLAASPAAAPVGTAMTFFVRGTNGAIFTTTGAGYSNTPWNCIGSPAAAQQAASAVTTFACQGTDHALWQATSTGGAFGTATSLGGTLTNGPAVAATSQQTDFLVEGADQAAWERTPAGWASLGGGVVGGIGATGLN